MTRCDTVLLADRVITPTGEGPAAVAVAGGRIVAVTELRDAPPAVRTVQLADDEVLMPGLVDTHVHLQESGRPGWEGVESGTRAAALGGTTTVVDMPLDGLPVTVDLASLEAKQRALRGRCGIDVGLWGGAVPGMAGMVELQLAGVLGFKAFLAPSGCQEFLPLSPVELTAALRKLVPTGLPLLVHAEDETHALPLRSPAPSYATYLASRPATVEIAAVAAVIDAVRRVGGRAHVVHVSSAGAVELLRAARREGLRVTAETCPHYLVRPAETIRDGDTRVKALPAVRGAAEADVLWQALADGVLDLVVSDHSPCAPGTKTTGDFALDAPGVSSLQLRLPVMWSAARSRGHSLLDLARWMAQAPADLARLPRKGRITVGADADLVVLAPDDQVVVVPADLAHRQRGTPYDGWQLTGNVRATWLRGKAYTDGDTHGRILSR